MSCSVPSFDNSFNFELFKLILHVNVAMLQVEICGTSWTYNPVLVTKVASTTDPSTLGASAGGMTNWFERAMS